MTDASIRAQYERWCEKAIECPLDELAAFEDDEVSLADAFGRNLGFGTGGMRGKLGSGPNRMNVYTVARATQGLANYLNERFEAPTVAIARDTRINGEQLERAAASVLAANGIPSFLFQRHQPTPVLSFAVRDLGCSAGICITAGHNSAEYNGFKVYDSHGCQIAAQSARDIEAAIDRLDVFDDVKRSDFFDAVDNGSVSWVRELLLDRYIDTIAKRRFKEPGADAVPISLVYTPLNGTGTECFSRIAKRIGVDAVRVVAEQADPDGHFPTCPTPDPEQTSALSHGLELAARTSPDLLLASDPPAGRIGVAAPRSGGFFEIISGNDLGILLLDYICHMRAMQGENLRDGVVITTIVSSAMVDVLATHYGFELRRTLAGFKYIGEQIDYLEDAGEEDRFLFGFEESCAYLSGTDVRDGDAIDAAMLVCQLFRHCKSLGKNIIDTLDDLHKAYGYYRDTSIAYAYPGADGAKRISAIMRSLREQTPERIGEFRVLEAIDYATPQPMPVLNARDGRTPQMLPCEDAIELRLEGDSKLIVRPSGTEPKIKAYLFAHAHSKAEADALTYELEAAIRDMLE